MTFKKDAKIETSDLWYDLTDGGYINPEELLEYEEDIKKVNEAIKTLMDFRDEANKQGIIEYM